jgi:hypothetical protein
MMKKVMFGLIAATGGGTSGGAEFDDGNMSVYKVHVKGCSYQRERSYEILTVSITADILDFPTCNIVEKNATINFVTDTADHKVLANQIMKDNEAVPKLKFWNSLNCS